MTTKKEGDTVLNSSCNNMRFWLSVDPLDDRENSLLESKNFKTHNLPARQQLTDLAGCTVTARASALGGA
jgi:hypothetical protein